MTSWHYNTSCQKVGAHFYEKWGYLFLPTNMTISWGHGLRIPFKYPKYLGRSLDCVLKYFRVFLVVLLSTGRKFGFGIWFRVVENLGSCVCSPWLGCTYAGCNYGVLPGMYVYIGPDPEIRNDPLQTFGYKMKEF